MPLSTWTELKDLVAAYAGRPDLLTIAPLIEDFIYIAEIQAQRDLQIRDQDEATTGTTMTAGQNYVDLPADFKEAVNFRIDTDPIRWVDVVSARIFDTVSLPSATAGPVFPSVCHHRGAKLYLSPTPASNDAYTLWYKKGIVHLGAGQATSWLLQNAPDMLLYGALYELACSTEDDASAQKWGAKYKDARMSVKAQEFRARTGGGVLRMRSDYAVTSGIRRS